MSLRKSKVTLHWSQDFSYAIGLITTDGCLSKDGRHIELTSKDERQIITFKKCLNIQNKISKKGRGGSITKDYFRVQFGDRNFYDFLLSIGLMPNKSKIIGSLKVPEEYFCGFLRGCLDGDGNINISNHPESAQEQLRVRFASASLVFLKWLHRNISKNIGTQGGWIDSCYRAYYLSYGKSDSIKLLNCIYGGNTKSYLERKYTTAKKFLRV